MTPPADEASLPLWVRGLDAGAIALGGLALFVLVFGGFILHLGFDLRVHSPDRMAFLALACVAIRHAALPRRPLHRRVIEAIAAPRDSAFVVPAALLSRVSVLMVGYFAVITIGFVYPVGSEVSPNPLVNLPDRFDAGWYAGIALDGYDFQGRFDRQQNLAFFPAFPLLERAAGYPLGAFAPALPRDWRLARLMWGGVYVSLIAFAWAAVYFWRLARDTIGEEAAPIAVALLAAYPFAAFFSAPYTESVFLLGSIAGFYHFRRADYGRAAAWGVLVGLTRPNGCFLSAALACLWVADIFGPRRAGKTAGTLSSRGVAGLLAAAAPGLGMLAYSAYVKHLTGSWFGWARLHEAWGRSYQGLAPAARAITWVADEGLLHVVQGLPFDALNALGVIFALVLLWPVVRRLGVAYAVFVVINLVPPLFAGGVLSMGRLTATLFPIFLALAAIVPRRFVPPLITAFAMGQGLAATLFFTWRELF